MSGRPRVDPCESIGVNLVPGSFFMYASCNMPWCMSEVEAKIIIADRLW